MSKESNPKRVLWIENRPKPPLCDVPWVGTSVILSDGRVNFCCFSSAVVGNVNTEPFEQIWNGQAMQQIRSTLSQQRLPQECLSITCPIYRGDVQNFIVERLTEHDATAGPGADSRNKPLGLFDGSRIMIARGPDEQLRIDLALSYKGDYLSADLFVGVAVDGHKTLFLPDMDSYPVPLLTSIELTRHQGEIQLELLDDARNFPSKPHDICVALFQKGSDPNVLANCCWSECLGIV